MEDGHSVPCPYRSALLWLSAHGFVEGGVSLPGVGLGVNFCDAPGFAVPAAAPAFGAPLTGAASGFDTFDGVPCDFSTGMLVGDIGVAFAFTKNVRVRSRWPASVSTSWP